jgi:hypothetical protein
VLRRQRNSAEELADFERARIFNELIDGLTSDPPAPQVHPR